MRLSLYIFCLMLAYLGGLSAQNTDLLVGRWQVQEYAEQGVQVNKQQAALPQARRVYDNIREQRARQRSRFDLSQGYQYTRKSNRHFDAWVRSDSIAEVSRIARAISMPHQMIYYEDGTMKTFNQDKATLQLIRQYRFQYRLQGSTLVLYSLPALASSTGKQVAGGVQINYQIEMLNARQLILYNAAENERLVLTRLKVELP